MSTRDAIIIGAGHNGLVCAAYLAKTGLDVLVLERSSHIGGGCVTQELVPGYRFSTFAYGAHGPGPKICRDLEIPALAFEIQSPDPSLVQLFPDGDRIVHWSDVERTERELARFGSREVEGLRRYRKFCARALAICQEFFLQAPPDPVALKRRWRTTEDAHVLDCLLRGSLWDVLCACFHHEKVRIAFARADDCGPTNQVGSALAEFVEAASTGLGVQNQSGLLEDGMGRITQVLAARVAAYGGAIRVSAPVHRIVVENRRAIGVELAGGEVLTARHVISNADPKRTFLQLVDESDLTCDFRREVENLSTRAGYMKFFATLDDFPRFAALRESEQDDARYAATARIVPSLEYMERCWADSRQGRLPCHPILSLQVPTAYWPSQSPPGKHILGAWVRWAPAKLNDGTSWEAHREEMADRIVEIVESYAPGFRRLVNWRTLLTPADIEAQTGMTGACIRHVDMTLDQMLHRRPLPEYSRYQSPIKNLWLCGSGTHPGGAVTGGPGHNCAAAILKESIE
jgi:phytoene dehydrogenase-like protein